MSNKKDQCQKKGQCRRRVQLIQNKLSLADIQGKAPCCNCSQWSVFKSVHGACVVENFCAAIYYPVVSREYGGPGKAALQLPVLDSPKLKAAILLKWVVCWKSKLTDRGLASLTQSYCFSKGQKSRMIARMAPKVQTSSPAAPGSWATWDKRCNRSTLHVMLKAQVNR